MAWEKCPKCGKHLVEYDGYHQIKRCYNDLCGVRINPNGSFSYIKHDSDKIRKIIQHQDGTETVVFERDYPAGF